MAIKPKQLWDLRVTVIDVKVITVHLRVTYNTRQVVNMLTFQLNCINFVV